MTTKPKAHKSVSSNRSAAQPTTDQIVEPDYSTIEEQISAVRREGFSVQQLRTATRLAEMNGLDPKSGFDAIRLLLLAGLEPFEEVKCSDEPPRKARASKVSASHRVFRTIGRNGLRSVSKLSHQEKAQAAHLQSGLLPQNFRRVSAEQTQELHSAPDLQRSKLGSEPIARIEKRTIRQSHPKATPKPPMQAPAPEGRTMLPQTVEEGKIQLPGEHRPDAGNSLSAEMERIQRDIVRRRRRNLTFLFARLSLFVFLPTILAFFYFAFVASPGYTTQSVFEVQQADAASSQGGLLGGTSMATSQDSIMVQDFLTSREALSLLDADYGYRAHFSGPDVDFLQRLPGDASNEDLFAYFQDNVQVSYDTTEGVIRMDVTALSSEASQTFSEALIGFAEERVDQVTERKRSDQMEGARASFDEAEAKMMAAQERVLAIQEQLGVIDPVSETTALMTQIGTFETQLQEKRLQLQQLLDNSRPNRARVAGVEGDIGRLENLIASLRQQMTTESSTQGSLASISAQLRMAEVDLETRTMLMQESLQSMEAARIEAMRQVRFLSLGVAPIPPDVPTTPKVFENTLITLLIFSAIYLLVSLTVAVLREQVSG